MGGGQMETPARGQAQPGQESHKANAAGRLSLSYEGRDRNVFAQRIARLRAHFGLTPRQAALVARMAWGGK